MTHGRAVAGMVLVTLMWSIAGVVTRQLEAARSFEVTFWRSLATFVCLGAYYAWAHGRSTFALLRAGGRPLWISSAMWSVMFTCFMVALTLTTVANVLITMALAPLITAVLARFTLGHPVAPRTWAAIVLAGLGIAYMYGQGLSSEPQHVIGTLVALGVPVASAINWNTLQRSGTSVDLVPALLLGALISAIVTLPLSLPLQASVHDVGLLGLLGLVQLAIPCVIAVRLARHLPAPEMSLLALLEIVFGIAWAWLGTSEQPSMAVMVGGSLVLGTLFVNAWVGLREARA
ncbi:MULTISPECIES: DMT family transporter [unclassified Rhizobacter]|uniref:DMT family transporter n=1 Tax=unclassified Rhizobacter TaxID=2640088 RepID=UPI0006FD282D|nr:MULTISPECIES: DMT family transporter [unclassified Rhizobacter]KQU75674.1 permease [Rhizobacter sp. Root29]KQW07384.1 permease [Rhizobacter sp. Root1238]KRB18039.1 permease [Rhizobacter sp. Root16D2]